MEGSHLNNLSLNYKAKEEESGWTAYFEEFSYLNDQSLSSSICASSMVSDAASFPKNNSKNTCNYSSAGISPKFPKNLRFKATTRAKEISHDDSLEDTATSPHNSPKVSDMGVIDVNSRRPNDNFNSSLGKSIGLDESDLVMEAEERYETSTCSGTNDSTVLKKRGLCLVPVSMLVNYLG